MYTLWHGSCTCPVGRPKACHFGTFRSCAGASHETARRSSSPQPWPRAGETLVKRKNRGLPKGWSSQELAMIHKIVGVCETLVKAPSPGLSQRERGFSLLTRGLTRVPADAQRASTLQRASSRDLPGRAVHHRRCGPRINGRRITGPRITAQGHRSANAARSRSISPSVAYPWGLRRIPPPRQATAMPRVASFCRTSSGCESGVRKVTMPLRCSPS